MLDPYAVLLDQPSEWGIVDKDDVPFAYDGGAALPVASLTASHPAACFRCAGPHLSPGTASTTAESPTRSS